MGFKRDGVDQMLSIFVLACMTGKSDTASVLPSNKPSEEPSVEPATEPNLPDDVDSDGYTEEAGDCDDWDPAVNPSAPEVWNGIDDDCNGWVDQDGVHRGNAVLNTVGVYQGQPYYFSDGCTGQIQRLNGFADIEINCEIDTSQPQSVLLLGERLQIIAEATVFGEETWQGTGVIAGSGGDVDWDTQMELTLTWSGLETDGGVSIQLSGMLDTFYLDGTLSGTFERIE